MFESEDFKLNQSLSKKEKKAFQKMSGKQQQAVFVFQVTWAQVRCRWRHWSTFREIGTVEMAYEEIKTTEQQEGHGNFNYEAAAVSAIGKQLDAARHFAKLFTLLKNQAISERFAHSNSPDWEKFVWKLLTAVSWTNIDQRRNHRNKPPYVQTIEPQELLSVPRNRNSGTCLKMLSPPLWQRAFFESKRRKKISTEPEKN